MAVIDYSRDVVLIVLIPADYTRDPITIIQTSNMKLVIDGLIRESIVRREGVIS